MSATNKDYIKSYCRSCCNENNHRILFKETINSGNDDYHCATEYLMVRCLGCGLISFREDFHDYEYSFPNENDEWEHPITTTIYPPYLKDHRPLERNWELPDSISKVYKESIDSLKVDCRLLAGVGFRAVIEAICLDKNIKGRNLEIQINNLAKEGLITKKECERLHSIRFLGNDSIHEMKVPETKQLKVVINIVEHLLKNIYLIDLEVDSTLEKPLDNFKDFKKLLMKKMKEYNEGDELPLVQFLGKDVRRVKDNFVQFERDLVVEINSGTFSKLTLGNLKPYNGSTGNVQHYVINKISS